MWLAALLAIACPAARAQRLSMPSGGTVVFTVDGATMQQAQNCPDCTLVLPDPHTTTVRIQRQGTGAVTLEASHSPWLPDAPLHIEARYSVRGNQSGTLLTTDFLPITTLPAPLFSSGDPITTATVEYRLRLGALVRAGTYETTVSYRVGGDTVSQQLRVVIAPLLELRFSGVPAGRVPSLTFDYAAKPLAYLQAVTEGLGLPYTAATFQGIEVLANDPRGFTLEVTLTQLSGDPLNPPPLYLLNAPAHRSSIRHHGVSGGYQTVIWASDFSLWPTGAEAPGSYQFLLTYTLLANP
jgi:hypothetical protein